MEFPFSLSGNSSTAKTARRTKKPDSTSKNMFDKRAQKAALRGVVADRKHLIVAMVTRTQFLLCARQASLSQLNSTRKGRQKKLSLFWFFFIFYFILLLDCLVFPGSNCSIFLFLVSN